MAIEITARKREAQGTGASRRLRRSGRVPGIVYGGEKGPVNIELDHKDLYFNLRNEKFHASILTLALGGEKEQVLLRAVNMHPYRMQVQHIDFQRVQKDKKIHMKVPLHFTNAETSPGVKEQGGVVRARALAKRLESDLAIIDKRRPKANVSEVMNVIGEVDGRTCVIMDDMVDTAGTLVKAAEVLKDEGAKKVVAYCTHAVLSGEAVKRIAGSDIDELVVTDTIPLRDDARLCRKIRQLSVAGLIAETILRIYTEESVSSLFIE